MVNLGEKNNIKLFCKLKCIINEYFLVVTSYFFNIDEEPENLIPFLPKWPEYYFPLINSYIYSDVLPALGREHQVTSSPNFLCTFVVAFVISCLISTTVVNIVVFIGNAGEIQLTDCLHMPTTGQLN